MSSTVEHKVEMYRLVRERRAAGKPVWDRKVRLGGVFHDEGMTFEERRDAIVARLRASTWFKAQDEDGTLPAFVEELGDVQDAGEFDAVWDAICDVADADRVWIETR